MNDPRFLQPKQTGSRVPSQNTVQFLPQTSRVQTDAGKKYYVQPVVRPKVVQ